MNELCRLMWCGLIGFFRSRASLEAEILVLRHQLNILRRKSPQRPTFRSIDRLIFAGPYGLAPNALSALAIVRPETVIRWHGAGFRWYWRWKSKSPGGRPKVPEILTTPKSCILCAVIGPTHIFVRTVATLPNIIPTRWKSECSLSCRTKVNL